MMWDYWEPSPVKKMATNKQINENKKKTEL